MFDFDLQMFADEATDDNGAVEDTSAEVSQDGTEPEPEKEAEKEPIPEELDGLPEEAAREVMAEAAKLEKEKEEPEPASNITDDTQTIKNGTIPYPRFKEKVDESNALKAQLEAYQKQFGPLSNQQSAPQQAQPALTQPMPQPRQQPRQMPQINLTPEIMKQIDDLKKQEAMRMSGLTQEDIDGMDYMEENDPRRAQYQFALKMAETEITNRIQQAQIEQMRQAEALLQVQTASAQVYNDFAMKESAEPDFQEIVKFGTEDYFFQKSPVEQRILAEAYARIENKVATPTEIMLIKNYYNEAKNAYRSGHYKTTKQNNNPMDKVRQAGTFPRSQQVEGSSDNDTGVSVATLEKMLEEKTWDEIPEKYQKMLMGS